MNALVYEYFLKIGSEQTTDKTERKLRVHTDFSYGVQNFLNIIVLCCYR